MRSLRARHGYTRQYGHIISKNTVQRRGKRRKIWHRRECQPKSTNKAMVFSAGTKTPTLDNATLSRLQQDKEKAWKTEIKMAPNKSSEIKHCPSR